MASRGDMGVLKLSLKLGTQIGHCRPFLLICNHPSHGVTESYSVITLETNAVLIYL